MSNDSKKLQESTLTDTSTVGSKNKSKKDLATVDDTPEVVKAEQATDTPREIGGPKGLEPTRYGDWESKGRCYDF